MLPPCAGFGLCCVLYRGFFLHHVFYFCWHDFLSLYSIFYWHVPYSLSRIIIGMPFGRYKRVFITSLNMVCNILFSSLPMVQPSHAYVIIFMMMVSTICHIACIFILLNSLLPVSEIILAVARFIFLFISAMWSDKLPLLFRISPRYLYAGTSSSSSQFSFR